MKKALLLIDWIGCPRNVLLKLRVEDCLKANGWSLVSPSQVNSCDIVVFCSCGFIHWSQKRSLQIIRAVHDRIDHLEDPPVFVVTGCLPPINRKELLEVHAGPAFGPLQIEKLDEIINPTIKIADIPFRNKVMSSERAKVVLERQKYEAIFKFIRLARRANGALRPTYYRAFRRYLPDESRTEFPFDYYQMGDESWCVVTSVGCQGNCSYCAIKFSKGGLKSRPLADIVQEARQGIQLGYKCISLIADDNGSYGRDIGTNLAVLLRELSSIEGDFSILIDSLNPSQFIEMFDHLMESFGKGKIKRLCLTMQHVSPRILSSMNRYYKVDVLKRHLNTLTTAFPDLTIDAHLIVGYPGETEEEFEQLISFAKWFFELNPKNTFKRFPFSANPGTAAAKMEGRSSITLMRERLHRLDRLQRAQERKLRRRYAQKMSRSLGTKLACAGLACIELLNSLVEKVLVSIEWRIRY
jgi:MiaB/RimO family radical SAM methylthiotransferase